jgi:hypothetical protein
MKKILQQNKRGFLLAGMVIFFILGGINQSRAHDDRDHDGFWDEHHHYRHYEFYHHHRGYWDERSGLHVFINVG